MNEQHLRNDIVAHARSLFNRGLSPGTSGNMSVRTGDTILVTPTGKGFGALSPDSISKISDSGEHISGPAPTKETFLHLAWYQANPADHAVVHLHSPKAAALACLADLDPDEVIPPLTPYFVKLLGPVPLIGYRHPGDRRLGDDILGAARGCIGVLLANHGSVTGGINLDNAVAAAEEFEAAAGIFLCIGNLKANCLDRGTAAELNHRYMNKQDSTAIMEKGRFDA